MAVAPIGSVADKIGYCSEIYLAVERFFRDVTVKRIRRGVFHSVAELQQAIREYIDEHKRKPKPYLWTAKARDILEKIKRDWMKLRAGGIEIGRASRRA